MPSVVDDRVVEIGRDLSAHADPMASALGDARRMLTGASIRAQCLECAGLGPVQARTEDLTLFRKLLATLGL